MLAVPGPHAHQVLAVASGFARAPDGLAVQVAHVGHQLAPLAGLQIDDGHAFRPRPAVDESAK